MRRIGSRTGQPAEADIGGMIRLPVLFALFALFTPSPDASAVEGYPGSAWGVVTQSSSTLSGSGGMGWINQGIDWITLPGGVVLNTFAEYRYRDRSRQPEYYSSQGPALGLEFKKDFLRFGADYYWETLPNYPDGPRRTTARELYLAGYRGWDLTRTADLRLPGSTGLPGSVWFSLFHDTGGATGSGGMGWINQGIDWITLPGGMVLNTYAEYHYRARSKLEDYYDVRGPAAGLELRKPLYRIGASYSWQYYPAIGERTQGLEFYLTWYVDWGLKNEAESGK